MKDEYDFSGGTRGKFHRPGAQVKLPYHRGSQSWLVDVAVTGRWWQPEVWREPSYVDASPWNAERLEAAFHALTKLYDEEIGKASFGWVIEQDPDQRARGERGALWRLLTFATRPDRSALLRCGLDAVDAGLFERPELAPLVRELRASSPHAWKPARFELRCLAALCNVGSEVTSQPRVSGKEPDFLLKLGGRTIFVEAQYAEEGEWAEQEQSWLWKLSALEEAGEQDPGSNVDVQVRLTERFQELQETAEGRSYLRDNIDRITAELTTAKLRLATAGAFPAIERIEGIVEIEVMSPTGNAGRRVIAGATIDIRREVARVVRGAVTRGAMRLPSDEAGIVLLHPGMHAPSYILVEEVRRWMAGDGAAYSNLAGVLILTEALVEPVAGVLGRLEEFVPVWRDGAPSWVVGGPWEQLSSAVSMREREALAHRCLRVGRGTDGAEGDDLLLAATG